jgi:hypothetical protein
MGAMMKNSLVLAVRGVILILALAMTACTAVKTDQAAVKVNQVAVMTDQVRVKYVPPDNPQHQQIYEMLKERHSLENLKEFLSPFRLDLPLDLILTGCDGEPDAMYDDEAITICYEYIEDLQDYMPEETTLSGIEPIDTLIGPFVDTVLHEFAHALFDYHGIPVLGREEDAADQVSALIYLQTNKEEARRLITGTVYAYMLEVQDTDPPDMEEYADEHSTSEQRAINLICLAYGADPELFADLPALGGLPQYRVDICEEEFSLISFAFQKLIAPHMDQELAKKVYAKNWLPGITWDLPDKQQ